jgi:hypothetical protein
MLSARQKVTPRRAKSRHKPARRTIWKRKSVGPVNWHDRAHSTSKVLPGTDAVIGQGSGEVEGEGCNSDLRGSIPSHAVEWNLGISLAGPTVAIGSFRGHT